MQAPQTRKIAQSRWSYIWNNTLWYILANPVRSREVFMKFSRSSRPEVFCEKDVLRNFEKFTGKHLCQRLFFNKVAGLRHATLLKKRLWHRCFPMNFEKFLRTSFLTPFLTPFFLGDCFWICLHYLFIKHKYLTILNGNWKQV